MESQQQFKSGDPVVVFHRGLGIHHDGVVMTVDASPYLHVKHDTLITRIYDLRSDKVRIVKRPSLLGKKQS